MPATSPKVKFTRIYRRYHGQVLAYCARRVGHLESDDVVNEVFEILWRKIDQVDEDRALPWLYGVAARTLMHRKRSMARWQRLVERMRGLGDVPSEDADHVVVLRERDRMVVEAMARLRPADQEVLRLAAWEELPPGDRAEALGCSIAAAEQRLHRAKRRLATQLSRSFDWGLAPVQGREARP